MLCIFKTPLDPHPDVPGKVVAQRSAGECQALCDAQVTEGDHDRTVRHAKKGRYLLLPTGAEIFDLSQREVVISPSCLKSDGTPITISDFPDNWSFGNGITVAATVPIAGSEPCVLSWAIFPDGNAAAVRAQYESLRQLMEN